MTSSSSHVMSSGVMYDWRVQSVYDALKRQGVGESDPVTVEQLTALGHLDQYHYLGAEATRACARSLGLAPGRRVLDIGSGIGGPSRMLAAISGCEVLGVELQENLVTAAEDLTRRAGLDRLVRFICGDAADAKAVPLESESFHHGISLLVLLHLGKSARATVLKRMYDSLVDGGTLLIEDFVLRAGVTSLCDEDVRVLQEVVHAKDVPSASAYKKEIEAAGFVDVDIHDMSELWKRWTSARSADFASRRAEMADRYGEEVAKSRGEFYAHVEALFAGNGLGGARITARKPMRGNDEMKIRHSILREGHDMCDADARALSRHGGPAVIHETAAAGGGNAMMRLPTEAKGADRAQPAYPAPGDWNGLHDSLQYHFVVPSKRLCIAVRVFYTPSLYHHSVWARTDDRDAWELVASDVPMTRGDGSETLLSLTSPGLTIDEDGVGAGRIHVVQSNGDVVDISFKEGNVFAWLPAGQQQSVIHRPTMKASIVFDGQTYNAWGYSKRYFGDYPRHWGYRFIHGVVSSGDRTAIVWTADATFGLSKYNYFHALIDGRHISSKSENTYQQFSKAYGILGGEDAVASLVELPHSEWIRDLTSEKMDSRMRQRFCELELRVSTDVYKGFAINETCFGSLC